MVKKTIKMLVILVIAVTAVGCATTSEKKMGNLTIRRYVEDRPRVDQDLAGNSGFVYGTPRVDEKQRKETRRLYYVEFSQQNPNDKVVVEEKDYALPSPKTSARQVSDDRSSVESTPTTAEKSDVKTAYYGYSAPAEDAAYDAAHVQSSAVHSSTAFSGTLPQEYTIQKDDTLQKVSQKFYGSYGKWTKIYDANKEALSDPNHIVPGKKITIPAL